MTIIEVVAATLSFPFAAIVGWMVKRVFNRLDTLEHEVSIIDKNQAVQGSQLSNMETDIHQINNKLDKIIDKLVA